MDRKLTSLLAGLVAASVLCACASTPSPPAPKSGDQGYRVTQRNGQEVYCKRELMTGSRTQATETCLTAAQMAKQRDNVEMLMRRTQDMSNGRNTNGGGGVYNNIMTQGGRSSGQ